MIYQVRPDARGSITLRSSSIDDAAVIRHGSLKTERDCQEMIDAVKLQRKVFAQSNLEGRVAEEILPRGLGSNRCRDTRLCAPQCPWLFPPSG
jgi:hypothetical protein